MQGHLSSIIKYRHYPSLGKDLALLRESDLFDNNYYTAYVPRLRGKKIDPHLHYLLHGGYIGRDPGPNFDSSWYLETYPEIRESGINPLVHYLREGKDENKTRYSKQNGPLIEFVGIPGSGKSTLYGQVNRLLGESLGYRPGPRDLWTRMAEEIRFKAVQGGAYQCLESFFLENKSFISTLLDDQSKYTGDTLTNPSNINGLLPYFFSLCAYYQATKEDHTKNWCLFDEGFFYYLFQYVNQTGNRQSQTIIEAMPEIDLLIHLNTDVTLCIERMKAREQGIPIPYRNLNEGDLLKSMTRLDDSLRRSLEAVKDQPINIIQINNNFSMDDSLSLIFTSLGPRLAQHQ